MFGRPLTLKMIINNNIKHKNELKETPYESVKDVLFKELKKRG
jgi:hypothetical protein